MLIKGKLIHPLWVHVAAPAVLTVLIVKLILAGPFPASAPVHFSSQGVPNAYGSPWSTFGLTIGLSLLFISLSIITDEIWAREERKKTFNWLSLFDDIIVGFFVGISLGYLDFLTSGANTFTFPWGYLLVTMGGAILISLVLELLRPYHPYPRQVSAIDTFAIEKELEQKLKNQEKFVYWQSQNPGWMSLVTVLIPLALIVGAVYSWFSVPWVSIELLVIGIGLSLFKGGMRTLVNRQNITVRFGMLGFKVKQIPLAEIDKVEIHEFSGFRDFGGFGIRFNGQMTAYFLRGSRGVKLTTSQGKQYLIGSDHPDSLQAVIKVLTGEA